MMVLYMRNILVRKILKPKYSYNARSIFSSGLKHQESSPPSKDGDVPKNLVKTKPLYKFALVFTGRYKRMADVPEFVPFGQMQSVFDRARVKMAIYMMVGTILLCIYTVYRGKQDAKRGDTLHRRQIEWQEKIIEEGRKEREAKAAAAALETKP